MNVIASFISEVTVNADASLDVRETITVRSRAATSGAAFSAIFRRSTMTAAAAGQVGFDVLDVRRDGRAEPWMPSNRCLQWRVASASATRMCCSMMVASTLSDHLPHHPADRLLPGLR
jgi:hypothetical protein